MRSDMGKVVIPRKILFDLCGRSKSCASLFLYIFVNANFKDSSRPVKLGGKNKIIREGEILITHKEMAEWSNLSISGVRKNINYMVSLGVIESDSYDKKGLLIKINDYNNLVRLEGDKDKVEGQVGGQQCGHLEGSSSDDIITKVELKKKVIPEKSLKKTESISLNVGDERKYFEEVLGEKSRKAWLETYKDQKWILSQIRNGILWNNNNIGVKGKRAFEKRTKQSWSGFFGGWLSRQWKIEGERIEKNFVSDKDREFIADVIAECNV